MVLLWIMCRTTGLPIGAERWTAEEVGVLDVVATTAEVVTLIASCAAVFHTPRRVAGQNVAGREVAGVPRTAGSLNEYAIALPLEPESKRRRTLRELTTGWFRRAARCPRSGNADIGGSSTSR